MAPIESPVAPPTFGSFGRSTGSRLRATSLARFHRFSNGCQTWTPGMFARCGDGTCDCCPYGYHIDLDFVRFCESLKDTAGYQSYLEHLQALKRGKREQRKALEEVYACPQLLFHPRTSSPSAKDHAGSTSDVEMAKRQQLLLQHRHQQNEPHFSFNKRTRPPIPFWWLCDVASPAAGQKSPCEDPEQDLSSLTDVIQDFEGTLHSSYEDNPDTTGKTDRTGKAMCPRKGAPQRYREGSLEPILLEKRLPPDGGDSISELKLNTKLTEEQCRRHVYSEEEQRKAEQLLDMIFGDGKLVEEIEVDDADYKDGGHRRKSARNADVSKQRSDSVSSSESINTISSLNYPTSSKVKMSVLKEEKRLLKLQLKAKNNLRDGKADPGAHEPPLSSRTGMSAAGSLLSVASTSRSHPGDESSRSQSRLPTTADTIHPPPPRPSMSVQSPVGSRGPLLPKLEPLKVEELPSSTSAMSPIRPSKLEALETGVARVMRGRRSVAGGGPDETEADWSGVHESATGTSLKDELWRETMQEPKYKSDQKGISGRASNKILGDYLAKASVNPEPLIIPGYYHHTGINCCTETQSRSTPMEGAQRRTAEPESVSPLPVPLREDRAESQMKTLCDECQKDSIRLRKDPRTSATQTTAVTPRDCVECVERRKRQLRSTAVNTDVRPITPEPLRKSAKEAFILDICDGTPFTPKSTSFCAECDRRRSVRSYSVGSATETPRTRDSSCDPLPELKPVFKKTPPTPPPKPAAFTRGVAVQCSTSITVSQAVQVTPERVRTRHVGAQSDWRACQRAQGTQTRRTENERSKKLDTNSVASGDYDVRHAVCDSCAHRRLRSIGTGDVAVYDTCCNRCAVFSKCDGAVQCELLTSEASDGSVSRANHRGIQKIEMKDQEVLTDDSYCDEITELIAIPCERCDVERRDFGFGDEDVFAAETRLQVVPRALIATEEVGVMTDHSIIEPLSFPPAAAAAPGGVAAAATTAAGGTALSRTSSASSMSHLTGNVRLCDKCSCAIESVAKDFIDQNLDHLVAEVTNDPPVPTLQSRIPKLSHSRGSRAPPRRTKPAPFDSVSRSLRRDVTPSASTAAPLSIGSLDDQPILANQTPSIIPGSMERLPGEKHTLTREMESACLILNEYLQRPEKSDPNKLKAAMSRIQTEWFGVTSGPETDPAHVQEILEELDKISNHLLHRVINMADNNGNTALHYAVSHGNFTVVTRLLDSRATDVNKQNRAGYTPVMLAALASLGTNEATQRAIVHRLFQMGDVNSKASQNGQTALMLAASHGRADMVKALLETGADPNTQDNDGSTALMCAAEHGYIDVVRMLLANPDVEINIADHDGQTALSIAMEAGHKDTALLIYASSNFSRGSSPYSSLRGRKSRISPRATPPPSRPSRTPPPPGPSRPSRTPPPPSPSRSRKGSTSSVSSFSRAWF